MNLDYLQKKIRPFVVNNQLTYDDFDKIFGQLPRREQWRRFAYSHGGE